MGVLQRWASSSTPCMATGTGELTGHRTGRSPVRHLDQILAGNLTAMSDIDVSSVRAGLVRHRDELRVMLQELSSSGDGALDFDENFADSGQVAAEQGENLILAGSLREQLNDAETALERLDAGDYGSCERCGQPIPPARLEAMPTTRFCIEHA